MITKSVFVSKCRAFLIPFTSQSAAQSAVREMEEFKLKSLRDSERIPAKLAEDCVSILFARVQLFKGYDSADKFLKKIDEWREEDGGS